MVSQCANVFSAFTPGFKKIDFRALCPVCRVEQVTLSLDTNIFDFLVTKQMQSFEATSMSV